MNYRQLRAEARENLKNRWDKAIIVFLIYFGISFVVTSLAEENGILLMILSGPLMFGISKYFLEMIRNDNIELNYIFKAFSFDGGNLGMFGKTVGAYFLKLLYVFLWTLLFIIPGIVASYSYRMIFLILVDDPDISITGALNKSKKMMTGNKNDLFFLDLSFLGWILLSLFTFGIGFIFLFPYMFTAQILFYERIKDNPEIKVVKDETKIEQQNLGGIVE